MKTSASTNSAITKTALSNIFLAASPNVAKIGVFSGPIPDINLVADLYNSTSVTCAKAVSVLGITESQFLGGMSLTSAPTSGNNTSIVVFLSAMTNLIRAVRDGTPTFAIIRVASTTATDDGTFANFASTDILGDLLCVSVGDEKSTADIQILGGKMVSGLQYRLTDLTINLL